MKCFLLLPLFGLAACGGGEKAPSPELPEVFQGRWANSFTDCSLEPGVGDAAPVALTSTQFIGLEDVCELTSLTAPESLDQAMAEWRCRSEGEDFTQKTYLRIKGDTLLYERGVGSSVTWTRCPPLSDPTLENEKDVY